MKIHDFLKRTTVFNATAPLNEPMISLSFATSPPLFYWKQQQIMSSRCEELQPPWRPLKSPWPKRPCAATQITWFYHSKESQLCFHAAHPPWDPPFSFRGHVFMKRNFQAWATLSVKRKPKTKLTFENTHCRNSNKRDFMILLSLIALRLWSNAAQSPWNCNAKWLHENSWKFKKVHVSSWKF